MGDIQETRRSLAPGLQGHTQERRENKMNDCDFCDGGGRHTWSLRFPNGMFVCGHCVRFFDFLVAQPFRQESLVE